MDKRPYMGIRIPVAVAPLEAHLVHWPTCRRPRGGIAVRLGPMVVLMGTVPCMAVRCVVLVWLLRAARMRYVVGYMGVGLWRWLGPVSGVSLLPLQLVSTQPLLPCCV